ncbi:glycoside hydrolase family 108 protein [Jannaschia pohangensis]|uniref:Predicted Peptidoglycan domain-containing protein n=1 Tax=Jannaschia pohangensis TaxID=390807 RepID=A0A1I3IL28_9RHOB|nr:glycosyl hydrolase 108 family protein [Jannaschia pohangensis]SFI48537.1 Predicted Peptidoglycan domain-containing protein [Jannaschia pohangensis]
MAQDLDPAAGQGVTGPAEAAADAQGSDGAVEATEQGCRGWVELDSRYWHVNDLGVSAEITVHRIVGGTRDHPDEQTELVDTQTLHYSAEAGERLDPASPVAGALINGNCRILLGGDEGYEAGQFYRLKLRPRDNPDNARKYVILPTPIQQSDATSDPALTAAHAGRRIIADPVTGRRPFTTPLPLSDTVDQHLRVHDTRTVGAAQWASAAFVMPCAPSSQPHRVDLRWIHYCNPRDFIYGHLLNLEGGFVNDPVDRGGATNMGITIATWQRFSQRLFGIPGTVDTLRNITEAQVYEITLEGYWRQFWCDRINNCPIAIQFLDTCFNGGGVEVLQRAINVVANAQGKANWTTTVDGGMGANTLKQANRIIECGHAAALYVAYREQRIARFREIVARNPSQQRFINGWLNRANEFTDY